MSQSSASKETKKWHNQLRSIRCSVANRVLPFSAAAWDKPTQYINKSRLRSFGYGAAGGALPFVAAGTTAFLTQFLIGIPGISLAAGALAVSSEPLRNYFNNKALSPERAKKAHKNTFIAAAAISMMLIYVGADKKTDISEARVEPTQQTTYEDWGLDKA